MADLLKPLGLKPRLKPLGVAALLALGTPVLAQDATDGGAAAETGGEAAAAATEAAPAAETAETDEAAPAAETAETGDTAEAAPAAEETAAAPSAPELYIGEVFTDWSRECVRRPEGSEGADPCWIMQVLNDDNGRAFGKFSVRRLPAGAPAVAQADVAVSMELVPYLPAGLSLGVDKGLAKEYQYVFCMNATGCMTQPNLNGADIEAFKAGDVLNMGFVIVARANELATINSPISLKGFTAAWNSLESQAAAAAPAAE